MRVLVVDDYRLLRELIATALGTIDGITVVASCGSGPEALGLASAHRPAVVLMNVSMPGMEGIEATRRLLTAHGHPAVVLYSDADSDPDSDPDWAAAAADAGAVYALPKATPLTEMVAAIVRAGERQLTRRPPVAERRLAVCSPAGWQSVHAFHGGSRSPVGRRLCSGEVHQSRVR